MSQPARQRQRRPAGKTVSRAAPARASAPRSSSPLATAALALAAALSAGMALLHLRLVLSTAAQEMREGAALWTTQLLLEGRNPYVLSELPAGGNVYGILYNLAVLPFARLFGNGFPVHRAVSAAAILAATALLWRMLRRRGVDAGFSLAGALCFYAGCLYFVTPLARPDALALLLSLASVAVLFEGELTWRRFLAGLALALPTLLAKVYLFYPPLVAVLWTMLFVSPRRGLQFGAVTGLAVLALLQAAALVWPAYVNVALIANARSAWYDTGHLLRQSRDWLVYSLPLVLAAALAPIAWLASRPQPAPAGARRAPGRTGPGRSAPRRSGLRPDPFWLAAAVNIVLFAGWLGGHPGAHMTYLFQLVTPMAILALWPLLAPHAWARTAVMLALPVSLVANLQWFPLSLEAFREAERGQGEIARLIAAHERVLGGTEVAGPLALAGRPVLDSGHTEYIVNATPSAGFPWDPPPLTPRLLLEVRWQTFESQLRSDLAGGRYDLVLRSSREGGVFPAAWLAGYRQTGSVNVSFPWSLQRWPVDVYEPQNADP